MPGGRNSGAVYNLYKVSGETVRSARQRNVTPDSFFFVSGHDKHGYLLIPSDREYARQFYRNCLWVVVLREFDESAVVCFA